MCLCIRLIDIVNVVCRDKRYACFFVKLYHHRQDARFLLEALILELEIEIALAEDFEKLECFPLRSLVVTVQEVMLDFAGKTCGCGDYAFTVGAQDFLVDAGLVVKALREACGHNLHQIVVACVVFGKEQQVAASLVLFGVLVVHGASRRINLAAEDWAYAVSTTLLIKIYDTKHHSVVGYRH